MKELLTTPDFGGFPLDLHHAMLVDDLRLKAFERALADVVRPGDTVLDVGSGTGILSFLAWRAGAGRVVGIESSEIVETAREVLTKCYPEAPVEFLRIDLLREALPELQADVIVCDLIGNLGPEEQIVPVLSRVRPRLLRPGGTLVPSKIRLVGCPVRARELYAELIRWSRPMRGVSLTPFQELAFNRPYHLEEERVELLAAPQVLAEIDTAHDESSPTRLRGDFEIDTDGELHGIVTWIEADLAPGVVLSTDPREERTHWGQNFLPVGEERKVARGTPLGLELDIERDDFQVEWRWRLRIGTDEEREEISLAAYGQS